jgi:hypothetical protein
MTTVVNLKYNHYDVFIGRGRDPYTGEFSKWANPFKIGIDGTREEVIEKYKQYVLLTPELLNSLYELKDKVLGCWCKPLPCHGDILIELVKIYCK